MVKNACSTRTCSSTNLVHLNGRVKHNQGSVNQRAKLMSRADMVKTMYSVSKVLDCTRRHQNKNGKPDILSM